MTPDERIDQMLGEVRAGLVSDAPRMSMATYGYYFRQRVYTGCQEFCPKQPNPPQPPFTGSPASGGGKMPHRDA
jgi:hypothetical protein